MANTIHDQLIAGLMLWFLLSLGTATIGTPSIHSSEVSTS
jgi:hypothetical protein